MNTTPRPIETLQGESYQATRFNALRHGVLSRYTVLPWEDEAEYRTLLGALVARAFAGGPDRGAPGRGARGDHLAQASAATGRGRSLPGEASQGRRQQPTDGNLDQSIAKPRPRRAEETDPLTIRGRVGRG